ncbi:MAG: glycosyltransferase [Acidimicrobiales bacterium]|nr:glycosyltransferase [Acidimicrobiales bacterium]MDG2217496.1 glycosyltransferase [Acidimicrobiales bacterium]
MRRSLVRLASVTGLLLLLATASAVTAAVLASRGFAVLAALLAFGFLSRWFIYQHAAAEYQQADIGRAFERAAETRAELHDTRVELHDTRAALATTDRKVADIEAKRRSAKRELQDELAVVRQRTRDAQLNAENAVAFARESVGVARSELLDLAGRSGAQGAWTTIEAEVDAPFLSIAIPGFNRPDELRACLQSIVDEVERSSTSRTEVWITDDRSTVEAACSVGSEFASRYPYIGFQQNPENVGLERNLLTACLPCRGEYVLILGNDDRLHKGGLAAILSSAHSGIWDVLVFDKVRVDRGGTRVLDRVAGSSPADIEPGEHRSYAGLLEFARETGLLSGFGFISAVVFRRTPFMAIDQSPYLGLTMYPQIGVLLEAHLRSSVCYHHVPIVLHRTTTRSEKAGEAVGRPEESFMMGGKERDARWFGITLAALLQRVIDQSSFKALELQDIPELLFDQPSLVGYLRRNRALADQQGLDFATDVREDAERLFRALGDVL